MKSMEYIEEIKNDYILKDDDITDILEKLAYIARDNGYDDQLFYDLINMID